MNDPEPRPGEAAPRRPVRDRDGLHKRRDIWHYRIKIDGRWREFSTKTKSYQSAGKIRRAALLAQEEGRLPSDIARAKLHAVAPRYIEERRPLVAPKTHRVDCDRIRPVLLELGEKRLCDITADDIRGFQARRSGRVSARTVNMETTVLRGVLKRYKLWGRLSDDFKALPEGKRGVGRALTDPEEKCLFDTAAQRPGWQVAYYAALLASNTTARGCELKALRLSDINLVEGTMTILRAGTKTDAGARSIPLNATARWAVARLIERVVAFGGGDPSNFLFPACESGSVDPSRPQTTWRTAWRNLTRAAGLPGFRFHDLRHHAITRLAEAGTPEQTLMALAGHVSREMMEHYSHVRQKAKREAVDLIDSYRPIEVEGDVAVAVH